MIWSRSDNELCQVSARELKFRLDIARIDTSTASGHDELVKLAMQNYTLLRDP